MREAGHVARIWAMANAYTFLARKPERNRQLGIFYRSWKDGVKMNLKRIGWKVVDWIHLAQYRNLWWVLINTAMNF
jgi:hypothetical protein